MELRFETIVSDPRRALEAFSGFCGLQVHTAAIADVVDPARARSDRSGSAHQAVQEALGVLRGRELATDEKS